MRTPCRSSPVRDLDRLGQLDRRRVARVAARNDASRAARCREPSSSSGRPGRGSTRTRRCRSGRRSVGRTQADDPAQRGRLLDRAARVGAERPRREARCDRRGRAARRAARHALGVPGVARRAEGRVLGRRAHRELVHVRLAEQRQAGLLASRGNGRVEDGDVAVEDLRARSRLDALRRDQSFRATGTPLPTAADDMRDTRAARRRARAIASR